MEAAALLPVLMMLFALLVQPVCVLYTRMVMRHAAAGAARVLATTTQEESARAYALRRLSAVPQASPFHVGGQGDWDVLATRSQDGASVEVTIAGKIRPLPLLGVAALLMGERDGPDVVLREHLCERVRPAWLTGGYEEWVQAW